MGVQHTTKPIKNANIQIHMYILSKTRQNVHFSLMPMGQLLTIPHLPGCFCPWTFFENIGFNTVPTDPFMSHLATQLGYSAGEFQALQLIVLAAFGVVD